MKVAILQPSFMPWRGYFDIMRSVDLFVYLDDVQYTSRDWRNRNRIKGPDGPHWITVPVVKGVREDRINAKQIVQGSAWKQRMQLQLAHCYGRSRFYGKYIDMISDVMNRDYARLVDLNLALDMVITGILSINTRTTLSSTLGVSGVRTERLLNILRSVNASSYLSGPAAKSYLDENAFRDNGISLSYKTYDYEPYPQTWGDFSDHMSIIDLIFNTGPDAVRHLASHTPDEVVA